MPFVVQALAWCSSHFLPPRAQQQPWVAGSGIKLLNVLLNTSSMLLWMGSMRAVGSEMTAKILVPTLLEETLHFANICHNVATRLLLPGFCAILKINTHIFTSRHGHERPVGEIFTSSPYTPRDDECWRCRCRYTWLPLLLKEELFTNSLTAEQINLACHCLLPLTGLFTPLLQPTCVVDLLYSWLQHFAGLR